MKVQKTTRSDDWVTMNGTHVLIGKEGLVTFGPKNLQGFKYRQYARNHRVVQGTMRVGTISYSSGASHIKQAMHAQGYDGLPKRVSTEEFKKAVAASSVYAQRTYSGTTKEVVEAYQQSFYSGDFYVDCSVGGSQYGKGMYCVTDYDGMKTWGMKSEISHYKEVNASKGAKYSITEDMTLDPSAKVVKFGDIRGEYIRSVTKSLGTKGKTDIDKALKKVQKAANDCDDLPGWKISAGIGADSTKKAALGDAYKELKAAVRKHYGDDGVSKVNDAINRAKSAKDAKEFGDTGIDVGVLATEMGYDAIRADGHGMSGSYTVVLNRTKLLIMEGAHVDAKDKPMDYTKVKFKEKKDGTLEGFYEGKSIGVIYNHNMEDDMKNRKDGGPGSGNWGHVGRPGERGGSGSGGGKAQRLTTPGGGFVGIGQAYKENERLSKAAGPKEAVGSKKPAESKEVAGTKTKDPKSISSKAEEKTVAKKTSAAKKPGKKVGKIENVDVGDRVTKTLDEFGVVTQISGTVAKKEKDHIIVDTDNGMHLWVQNDFGIENFTFGETKDTPKPKPKEVKFDPRLLKEFYGDAAAEDIPFGVGVLVTDGKGNFLCGIRSDNGEVCGPGGHIQKNEKPEDAAVRETVEEFGITPKGLICIGCLEGDDETKPSMVFLAKSYEGEIKTTTEMYFPRFVSVEDLKEKGVQLHLAFKRSLMLLTDVLTKGEREDGGAGSGNWGHAGRPGERGGSASAKFYNPATGKMEKHGISADKDKSGAPKRSGKPYRLTKPDGGYTGLVWAYRRDEIESMKKSGKKPITTTTTTPTPDTTETKTETKTEKKGTEKKMPTPKTLQNLDDIIEKRQDKYDKALETAPSKAFVKKQDKITIDTMKKAFEKQDFVSDCPDNVVVAILQTHFKSQIETGTTGGFKGKDVRKAASQHMFGTPGDSKNADYEKYGHLGSYMTHYGKSHPAQLVFKKDRIWDRTTFTMGDSLGESYQPCKVSDPRISAFAKNSIPSGTAAKDRVKTAQSALKDGHGHYGSYVELQFHGKITHEDIAAVRIPKSSSSRKEIEAECAKLGIAVEYI